MERIIHPVSGELGFFATEKEKVLIDAILVDFSQSVLQSPQPRSGDLD